MELHELKEEFNKIIKKYKLDEPSKATEISEFLTSGKQINAEEFAKAFKMEQSEADIFISFIMKGIQYKEEHIDPNSKE